MFILFLILHVVDNIWNDFDEFYSLSLFIYN